MAEQLPQEAAESSMLEVFRNHLDVVLGKLAPPVSEVRGQTW